MSDPQPDLVHKSSSDLRRMPRWVVDLSLGKRELIAGIDRRSASGKVQP